MPGFAQTADGLHPTEDLFHRFAFDLSDGVARTASGSAVDGAVSFAGDVRSDLITRAWPSFTRDIVANGLRIPIVVRRLSSVSSGTAVDRVIRLNQRAPNVVREMSRQDRFGELIAAGTPSIAGIRRAA